MKKPATNSNVRGAGDTSPRGAGFQPATRVHDSPHTSKREPPTLRRPFHEDLGSTAYFITTRCRDSQWVFRGEAADAAVNELFALRERYGFLVLSFVFMSNHAHFVIVPAEGFTISQTMRVVKGAIARRVNVLLKREGPLWQDGFRDNAPQTLDELNNYVRYIENNPVKAGLCKLPSEFRHSSGDGSCMADYYDFLGLDQSPRAESPRHEDAAARTAPPRAESPRHDESTYNEESFRNVPRIEAAR